ncbi:MAG: hypothetical protein E7658_08460 [Ruminococcaceae bacterium]|nr:hypothetical protein [Oscillospiraceae bacterium]
MNTRMRRDKFYFGFHGLNRMAMNEDRIRDIAETNVDFLMYHGCKPWLDACQKYGLGVVQTWFEPLPHWGGEGYGYVGRMEEKFPLSRYTDPAKTFEDHPAIWGLEIGDEPNSVDFPYIGKVVEAVNNVYPNQFPFLNLYPNYASVASNTRSEIESQLGTSSYEKYIERYCDYIPNHYISMDFYPYRGRPEDRMEECWERIPQYYGNLRVVADACHKTGRDLWAVLQGNHDEGEDYGAPSVFMTIDQIRCQVYAAMAFGVKVIMWWEAWVFDDDGNKTKQYNRIKLIHDEVHALAEEYMKYRNVDTQFVGFDGYRDFEKAGAESRECVNTSVLFDVKADDNSPLVIGRMVSETDTSQALLVFAADDPFDIAHKEYNITFRTHGSTAVNAYAGDKKLPVTRLEDGSYSVPIASNMGVLITAK